MLECHSRCTLSPLPYLSMQAWSPHDTRIHQQAGSHLISSLQMPLSPSRPWRPTSIFTAIGQRLNTNTHRPEIRTKLLYRQSIIQMQDGMALSAISSKSSRTCRMLCDRVFFLNVFYFTLFFSPHLLQFHLQDLWSSVLWDEVWRRHKHEGFF